MPGPGFPIEPVPYPVPLEPVPPVLPAVVPLEPEPVPLPVPLEVDNCGDGIALPPDGLPDDVPVPEDGLGPTGALFFGTATLNGLFGAVASFGMAGFGISADGLYTGL